MRYILILILFGALLHLAPPTAHALTLPDSVHQAELVQAHVPAGSTVLQDGVNRMVAPDGLVLLGFSRDAKESAITVTLPDGQRYTKTISVLPRQWDIQRINGLASGYVSPDKAALKKIADDNRRIGAARKVRSRHEFFREGFIAPVDIAAAGGRISGVFGSQRILNNQPRNPHNGLDLAAPTGTPVIAPAEGIVLLVVEDMYYTGGTVMLDHGYGLTSVYAHLHSIDVTEGQHLKQGDAIGTVGATGRATGPHLHWGITLGSTHLDPQVLLK